ncbi:hypothetical protein QYZ88_005485 [Lachnospiraceae bacterium C1.1]
MMRKKLLLFIIYGFIFISFFYGFNLQEPSLSVDFGDGTMYAVCYTEAGRLINNIVSAIFAIIMIIPLIIDLLNKKIKLTYKIWPILVSYTIALGICFIMIFHYNPIAELSHKAFIFFNENAVKMQYLEIL